MSNKSEVADFFVGKSVFVTGCTGFLGKVLLEKLLFSCDGIKNIYVLVREKKGQLPQERIKKLCDEKPFERLRSKPGVFDKIIPFAGNITKKNLGLSEKELEILTREVSIVFHLAATVSFNEPLKDAIKINVDGTQEIINLCHRIKHIQALVHVSTAFSNVDREQIDEVVYPPKLNLEYVRETAELHSNNEEVITKLLDKMPNTYTLTKSFAEDVVLTKSGNIPTCIVRPSIVISTLKEPIPGWVDNWNGVTGLLVGLPLGYLRMLMGNGDNVIDLIPVDIVTNLTIAAATRCQSTKAVAVYNCCTGASNPILINQAKEIAKRVSFKHSLNKVPYPHLVLTTSYLIYLIGSFFLEIIPAYLMDFWSMLQGKPAKMVKTQRRFANICNLVKFFSLNQWQFKDVNVRNLYKELSENDKNVFNFDVTSFDWESGIEISILGSLKYLLKDRA